MYDIELDFKAIKTMKQTHFKHTGLLTVIFHLKISF